MNKFLFFLLLIFLFNINFTFSQGSKEFLIEVESVTKNNKIENKERIELLNELLKKQDTTFFSEKSGFLYHELGKLYFAEKLFTKAIKITNKAIINRKFIESIDLIKLNNSLYNNYCYYLEIKESNNSKKMLKQIIANGYLDSKYTYEAFEYLAYIEADNGDYYNALTNFNHLELLAKKYNNNEYQIYANTGSIHIYSEKNIHGQLDDQDLIKVNDHYNNILKIERDFKIEIDPTVYNNLANIFENNGNRKTAIELYEKSLKYYKKSNEIELTGEIYNNLGVIYAKDNVSLAKKYFEKALKYTNDIGVKADAYNNIGYYLETKKSKEKIAYYLKAMKQLLPKENLTKPNDLPSFEKIKQSDSKLELLFYLTDIANTWYLAYEEEQNVSYLVNAKNTLFLIDKLISYIRFEISEDKSKLFG